MQQLICFGVSHRDAGIAVRERLALAPDALESALNVAAKLLDIGPVSELVILSTCNRSEWYAVANEGPIDRAALEGHFAAIGNLPEALLREYGQLRTGHEAAKHLCRVAAGLESQLIGECEILGQVDAARAAAVRAGTIGAVLTVALRAAIRAGRRVRAETALGHRNASMAAEAVQVASRALDGLAGKSALVMGTGVIGRQALLALREAGVTQISVSGRDAARLNTIAAELGARPVMPPQLRAALAGADLVVCATAARKPVITVELVGAARAGSERPLLIVDIGLPRNAEREVGHAPFVTLLHLDELAARAERSAEVTEQAAAKAAAVVAEELTRLEQSFAEQRAVPVLRRIHQQADAIRRRQMARLVKELGPVPADAIEPLERFSRALVSQVLDAPSRRLRRAGPGPAEADLLVAAQELFGLGEEHA